MVSLSYYQNLDSHPFTGRQSIDTPIKVKVRTDSYIQNFFNGAPGYEQVTTLTIGKVYEIHAVEGFGDVADAFVTDDNGNELEINIDFLQEAKE